jgi:hypothetical protein
MGSHRFSVDFNDARHAVLIPILTHKRWLDILRAQKSKFLSLRYCDMVLLPKAEANLDY